MKFVFFLCLMALMNFGWGASPTERTHCYAVDSLSFDVEQGTYSIKQSQSQDYVSFERQDEELLAFAKLALSTSKKLCLTWDPANGPKPIRMVIRNNSDQLNKESL